MMYDRDSMKRFGAAVSAACTNAFKAALKDIPENAGLEWDPDLALAISKAKEQYAANIATEIEALEKTL